MGKIIDQRGRLFGLINVIDLFAILFLLSFIPILYFGYKVIVAEKVSKPTRPYVDIALQDPKAEWVSVQIKVTDMEPELVKFISQGDIEKDFWGKTIGRLTNVSIIRPSKTLVLADNRILSVAEHPIKKEMLIDMDILCLNKDDGFYYKNERLAVGSVLEFKSKYYILSSIIVDIRLPDAK